MKYVKKPMVIDAVQWDGDNIVDIINFLVELDGNSERSYSYNYAEKAFVICTLEGDMKATIGDYIIRGIKGEFYPCKPDIFENSYEEYYESECVIDDCECHQCDCCNR